MKTNYSGISRMQELEDMSVRVIVRKNIGYEMKAYEEFFLNDWHEYKKKGYNEIIMCNDSFYGPFVPLKELVKSFQNDRSDFWGMNLGDNCMLQVLHSYFRVFRKKIIDDGALEKYFEENRNLDICCGVDAVAIFEYGLFAELIDRGYTYSYYSLSGNKNIYSQPYTLVRYNKFPIVKRKAFSGELSDAQELKEVIKYVDEETDYNVNLMLDDVSYRYGDIWKEARRKDTEVLSRSKRQEIIQFLKNNSNIYIYGAGLKGRKFWSVYRKQPKIFLLSFGHSSGRKGRP